MRVLVAAGLVVALLAAPAAAAPAAPAAAADGAGLAVFGRQQLVWTGCPGIDNPRLRCASVQVPLDYAHPAGRRISVAISRLPATAPARRRGVLLTTGGGPGEAGVPLPAQLSGSLDPAVLAGYDLVGYDLRFLERSTPISCGQPAEEPGGFWVRVDGLQPFADTAAQARALARACARHAGWALPFATTANAARDLDIIRAVLGQPRISFLGGSYAALVGVAYSTLFPRRVDRLVLDSPPDYDTVWRRYELDRTAAMQANYDAFTGWLADRDSSFGLGATPGAVDTAVTALLTRADAAPIPAGGHGWTSGELGYLVVLGTFFEQLWPVVAVDLASIRAGAAPPVPLPVEPAALPGTPGVPADNHTAVNTAFRCGDNAWPRRPGSYRRDLADLTARFPTYGPGNANIGPCAFWPTSADNTIPLAANRAHGALVTAARQDAAVPLANSVATAHAIAGARLVTVNRRVHVPFLSGQGGGCMTAAVTGYLLTGQLPPADLAC
ncbi:MAG TPA: alpha/beta fold hydrolase [Mycobacteriales bacterium]|nr:alpha/beta fold hydrolase [Mycobacteriales bacterium]